MANTMQTSKPTPRPIEDPATLTEGQRMVREMRVSGSGPLMNLRPQDIQDIVASYAPYGRKARAEYFARLQAEAERYPCEYE